MHPVEGGGDGGAAMVMTETAAFAVPLVPGRAVTTTMREASEQARTRAAYSLTLEEIYEHEEVLKLRLQSLRKEEAELSSTYERLVREKEAHLKEVRRLRDERNSRFHAHKTLLNERYLLMSLIGKGGFSEVYKAFDMVECRQVACKINQLNPAWSESKKASYMRHTVREYRIHATLHHPRVIRLYDVFEINDVSFCTVLHYCPHGDLQDRIYAGMPMTEREAKSIIVQIVHGLRYLNEIKPPTLVRRQCLYLFRKYLEAEAQYELNIPAKTLQPVQVAIRERTFSLQMFEGVLEEVVKMMYENNVENFMAKTGNAEKYAVFGLG